MKFPRPQAFFDRSTGTRPAAAIALLAALFSSSAYGADYSTPRPLPDYSLRGTQTPVLREPLYPRWAGLYFGLQGGYSAGSADMSGATGSQISYILANTELQGLVSDWTTLAPQSSSTQSYGGFIGYNIQWGEVITGVELNYNRMNFRTGGGDSVGPILVPGANLPDGSTVLYSVTVASNANIAITDIMTSRVRAGWAYERMLPYGFVGLALGRADTSRTASVTGSKTTQGPADINGVFPAPVFGILNLPRNPQSESKTGQVVYGWTAGLGVELGLLPNLFLRAEYEFVQFPEINGIRVTVNSGRVGVALKF